MGWGKTGAPRPLVVPPAAMRAQDAVAAAVDAARAAAVAATVAPAGAAATLGKFTVPAWAQPQPHDAPAGATPLTLEAIKDGAVVHSLDLAKRPYFVLGKQKELVHVQLEHGSISRQHCAIVHGTPPKADGGGDAWLIDLESAHGTYMGASADALRKIKPHVPYPLAPGTIVRVGKSSRVYKVRAAEGAGEGEAAAVAPAEDGADDSEPPAKRRRGDDDA